MPNDVTNTNAAILTLDSDAVLETAQSKQILSGTTSRMPTAPEKS